MDVMPVSKADSLVWVIEVAKVKPQTPNPKQQHSSKQDQKRQNRLQSTGVVNRQHRKLAWRSQDSSGKTMEGSLGHGVRSIVARSEIAQTVSHISI